MTFFVHGRLNIFHIFLCLAFLLICLIQLFFRSFKSRTVRSCQIHFSSFSVSLLCQRDIFFKPLCFSHNIFLLFLLCRLSSSLNIMSKNSDCTNCCFAGVLYRQFVLVCIAVIYMTSYGLHLPHHVQYTQLYDVTLHFITLQNIIIHTTTLHYTTVHYITLYYTALPGVTLCYITLH